MISRKLVTLLILVTCSACATFWACGGLSVRVFAFDNSRGILYHGKIEAPDETIPYGDKRLVVDGWIAMPLSTWQTVKIYCKAGK